MGAVPFAYLFSIIVIIFAMFWFPFLMRLPPLTMLGFCILAIPCLQ
uniref:Uncharacterized protein n=1 Tax=Rhizophora mucronata TaxID=61149 RepID=A0A2P2PVF8_RHIMU